MASGATAHGRLGVVYPRATVDSVPCLSNTVELLARHGYGVDLFAHLDGVPHPSFESDGVVLRSLGAEAIAEPDYRPLVSRLRPRQAARLLGGALRRVHRGGLSGRRFVANARAWSAARSYVRRVHQFQRYRCFIGVDPEGVVLADALAGELGIPVAYLSLELLLSYELGTRRERQLKAREVELSRRAPFVIVQDEERGRLLMDDNALTREQLVLLPNAPLGPARRARTDYWERRFGLSPEQRIVLHSGSLGEWTGIDSIVESASGWPERWVLVVHTRYSASNSSYVEKLRARARGRPVFFSLDPVSRQEYDDLVDGADVGIAFYVPSGESAFTQRNLQTIGLSSGKLAHCTRAGLPTVVNCATSIGELVERQGCGIAVQDASQIGPALERIGLDYASFSQRACQFFDAHLEFGRGFEQLVGRIDRLSQRANGS